MKSMVTVLSFFISTGALAESYKYDCKLLTDPGVTKNIVVSTKKMIVLTKVYGGIVLESVFDNAGQKGGSGKMKERVSFVKNFQESTERNEEIYEFLLTPGMLTGGSRLRNGSMGGLMSYSGHGYRWETFLCLTK